MTYQVSIFLENKIGHFERVTKILRESSINIRSMTLNNTVSGWGILNLVVDNPEKAQKVLTENGLSSALREILVLQMDDKPGGLDEVLRKIADARINFVNAYGINRTKDAFLIIDVEDVEDAREKMIKVGVTPLTAEESYIKK